MPRRPNDSLATYTQKRDFTRSPEPSSGGAAGGNIFVVQHHWARRDHYDFRLELDGVLVSWAVTRGPSLNPADKRLAVRTEDHPLSYAEFEGLIPQGEYGGGTVMLWDRGVWEPISADPAQAIADGSVKFRLFGERMRGAWALVRIKPEGKRENWLLIKEKDEVADRETAFVEQYETSVSTGRNRAEIEAGKRVSRARKKPAAAARNHPLPAFVPPCLCKTRDAPPSSDGWLYEMKYDGYRLQAACSGSEVRLYTREGHDWTARFPSIAQGLRLLDLDGALIDGEAVVFDRKGLTDFPALVAALEGRGHIAFVAFDMLSNKGADMRDKPLSERRRQLDAALQRADGQTIRIAAWHERNGVQLFASAVEGGAEGIICKKASSPYKSGRSDAWLKVKGEKREDVIIVGYSPSDKRAFASLVAAVETDGELRYAGRVGGGFTDKRLSEIKAQLDAIRAKTPPPMQNASAAPRGIIWVEPRLRAEIELAGWTGDAHIRQGRFLGWREDRTPVAAKIATAKAEKKMPVKTVSPRLTNAERVMFPETGLTKGGMADYYEAVADRILPHLHNRPVSFVRAPEGLAGETFFQRHVLPGMKRGIGRVPDPAKEHADYLTIKSVEGLMTAAQFSVIEFHGWGAVTPNLDAPDRVVFDLDPDEAIPFSAVRDAAFQVRDLLTSIGLQSFAMASGGKGVHVIVPLDRTQDWEAAGDFTSGIAKGLASAEPSKFVAIATKARRKGRIYIDWLRNKRSATAIVPWSLRARAQATAAFPVSWDDLKTLASPALSHAEVARRSYPWDGFFKVKQRLPEGVLEFLSGSQQSAKKPRAKAR